MVWSIFRNRSKSAQEGRGGVRTADPLPRQDTKAAIDELSRVVQNDPEAVEIYLALGSLYRSQGELERAIQIRNNLIARPGLNKKFKARAWFELGRDFRRAGFLDRASDAFIHSRDLGGDRPEIMLEMARLAADSGKFDRAALLFGKLRQPHAEAHYLVRQAQTLIEEGEESAGMKLVRQAQRAYSPSPEAWLTAVLQAARTSSGAKTVKVLREAVEAVEPELRFLLLEGLLGAMIREGRRGGEEDGYSAPSYIPVSQNPLSEEFANQVVEALSDMEPDVYILYYSGRFLALSGQRDGARSWLEKALMLAPQFWPARLELFQISLADQTLTPAFREQVEFFADRAGRMRRFMCRSCGLKRDTVFFICPRCGSWHSIAFLTDFTV